MKTLFLLSLFVMAQDLKPYLAEKDHFAISMPGGWEMSDLTKTAADNPVHLEIMNSEKTASLLVMVPKDGSPNCVDFLKSMDSSRKLKNNLKPEQLKLAKDVISRASADEGSQGEYLIEGTGPGFPVVQKSYCFKKKNQIRVITVAYRKEKGAQFEPLFTKVIASFKFVPNG